MLNLLLARGENLYLWVVLAKKKKWSGKIYNLTVNLHAKSPI